MCREQASGVHAGNALLDYFTVDEIYDRVLLQGGRPGAAAAVLTDEYTRRTLQSLGFSSQEVDRQMQRFRGNIEAAADGLIAMKEHSCRFDAISYLGFTEAEFERQLRVTGDAEFAFSLMQFLSASQPVCHTACHLGQGQLAVSVPCLHIRIETLSHGIHTVRARRVSTILNIKQSVMRRLGFPVEQQTLLVHNRDLSDCVSLASLGIECDSTLYLRLTLSGGGSRATSPLGMGKRSVPSPLSDTRAQEFASATRGSSVRSSTRRSLPMGTTAPNPTMGEPSASVSTGTAAAILMGEPPSPPMGGLPPPSLPMAERPSLLTGMVPPGLPIGKPIPIGKPPTSIQMGAPPSPRSGERSASVSTGALAVISMGGLPPPSLPLPMTEQPPSLLTGMPPPGLPIGQPPDPIPIGEPPIQMGAPPCPLVGEPGPALPMSNAGPSVHLGGPPTGMDVSSTETTLLQRLRSLDSNVVGVLTAGQAREYDALLHAVQHAGRMSSHFAQGRSAETTGMRGQIDMFWLGSLPHGESEIVRMAAGVTSRAVASARREAQQVERQITDGEQLLLKPRPYLMLKRHIDLATLKLVDKWFEEQAVPSKDAKHVKYIHISELPMDLKEQALADHPEMVLYPEYHKPPSDHRGKKGHGTGGKGSSSQLTRLQRGWLVSDCLKLSPHSSRMQH